MQVLPAEQRGIQPRLPWPVPGRSSGTADDALAVWRWCMSVSMPKLFLQAAVGRCSGPERRSSSVELLRDRADSTPMPGSLGEQR